MTRSGLAMPDQFDSFPTVVADPDNMPDGFTAYLAVLEDMQGGTVTLPIAAGDILEAVRGAHEWAKANAHDVRTITEFGWSEGLVGI